MAAELTGFMLMLDAGSPQVPGMAGLAEEFGVRLTSVEDWVAETLPVAAPG